MKTFYIQTAIYQPVTTNRKEEETSRKKKYPLLYNLLCNKQKYQFI